MRLVIATVVSLCLVPAVYAQAATVALFPAAATDANTARPLSSVTYAPICGQTPTVEAPPIVNPVGGFYPDPANPLRDCRLDLSAQVKALPAGSDYKGAVKIGSAPFGPLSSAFAVAAAQTTAHPCDTTPASPATRDVGQVFTLGWCHAGVNVTAWRVYRNGVLIAGVTVTPGTTTNAAGDRFYTVPRTEAAVASNVVYEVAGVNGTTEAAHLVFPGLSVVQPPPPAPLPATRGRIF